MASLKDTIAAIKRLQHFSDGANWRASRDGRPIGPVEDVGIGTDGPLLDPRVWVRARFQEGGRKLEVRGEHEIAHNRISITFGPEGSTQDVQADELVLSNRLVTTAWRVVLEYVFEAEGVRHRYRFDGTAVKADDIVKGIIL